MTFTGPTLARRMLARLLRELRGKSGVSAELARQSLGVSKQTLWRIETGQPTRLNPPFIQRLCALYGANDVTTSVLLELAEEAHQAGWWHEFDNVIPKHFELFVGLENAAKRIVSYRTLLLPGLLQTDEYRRALIWLRTPTMPSAEVERRVEMLNCRKARLQDPARPLMLHAVIDEAALRRAVGGRSAMADQLNYLAAAGDLPNVSVQVIPLSAEAYGGLDVGPFELLEFPRHVTTRLTEPPVVCLESYTDTLYLDKVDEVQRYQQVYAELQRTALDEAHSRSLIHKIAKESAA
ncbi:helix-turn-helix transcriptional regulator [Nocardia sp. CS682]|uniref:helix-turn-helix domain-containing protein n=1 Tax=Nocardia sp. CS682 TaxID=1047172 RepID=UPI001075020F|nr:helix-turn-helix transcriptional regulator [Nocardia sp. CS682]QBS44916.1 DNA-binding protein [Nocardia sp. CS682]